MVPNILTAIRVDAFELARSGHYANCHAIVVELERRGYERARLALRDLKTRAHLDDLCIQHWKDREQRLLREWSQE